MIKIIGDIIKIDEDKGYFYIKVPIDTKVRDKRCKVSFIKETMITDKQRAKIYALIKDIGLYIGYPLGVAKMVLKMEYMKEFDVEDFSFSNTTKENAIRFITFLVDYVLKHNIPCQDSLIVRCEDIDHYLYSCLIYKSCAICGKNAELHHVDVVGTGRDRTSINHLGLRAIALCRKHHTAFHTMGEYEFNKKYHCYGIKLNEELCKKYDLPYEKEINEC